MKLIEHFVNGKITSGKSNRTGKIFNPATGSQEGEVKLGSKEDLNTAVEVAKKAFNEWSAKPPIVRARIIFKYKELIEKIKHRLKTYASPKHVPTNIIQVDDIPKTISGKISELSVKSAIEGKQIKNIEALSNPDSLIFFKQFAKEN